MTETHSKLRSMTGFARATATGTWGGADGPSGELIWELKAVNHRYCEVSLRLPDEFRSAEHGLRKTISDALVRGKCEATLRFKRAAAGAGQAAGDAGGGLAIDMDRVRAITAAAAQIAAAVDNAALVDPLRVLQMDGVIIDAPIDHDALIKAGTALLGDALDALDATRRREGAGLAKVLANKADEIDALCAGVREQLPKIRAEWEAKLRERVSKYTEQASADIDSARLEQEFLLLANKTDAEEELDRLKIHTAELRDILDRDAPAGRRLDFLMQELNREANTLSSKSQDSAITRLAVDLKVAVEQAREQVQNIV